MNMKNTNVNVSGFTQGILLCAALVTSTNVAANPGGASVVRGNVSFSHPNANTLNVTNTPGAIINWQQFGISQGELTHFQQQSSSSTVLNRVTGQNPSDILGSLTSNGRVFLVNPNGVMFGQNAIIDTAGLIASTLAMSDRDFLNGNLHFEDLTNASQILNKGFIHTSNAGEVVLVAPNIRNEGTINVEQGNLVLAAGQSVTVSSLNHKNITFEVQAPSNKVVNIGKLMSDGGSIGVFAGSIKNTAVISANAITVNDAGQIVLLAKGDNIQDSGKVTASSRKGKGGHIEILGERVGLFGKSVADASGKTGGGEVLVGGDYQGKTQSVKNAKQTVVSKDSEIHADATDSGDGGKAIVWADGQTAFTGSITAKAGNQGGDGGFIEISGKQHLTYLGNVNASAKKGKAGSVLFDPIVLTITPRDLTVAVGGQGSFFVPTNNTDSTIDASLITAITNGGTAVELLANNDIVVNQDIITLVQAPTVGGDLLLRAGRSISINANIDTAGGNFSAVINESIANGIVDVERAPGIAEFKQANLTSINTGAGSLNITVGGDTTNKTNFATGDVILADVNAANILVTQNGTGGKIIINNASPLNLGGNTVLTGNAQINGDVLVSGGSFAVTGTTDMTGNYSQTGGVATFGGTAKFNNVALGGIAATDFVLNGVNNVIATLNMNAQSSLARFLGTGNTSVNGLFTWNGGQLSHNLTLNGDVSVGGSGATINGGVVMLAGGTLTTTNDLTLNATGRFINNGSYQVTNGFSFNSIRSLDGTGVFENNGLLSYSGVSFSSIGAVFINTGTVDVGSTSVSLTNALNEWNGGVFKGASGDISLESNIVLNGVATKTIDGINVTMASSATMTVVGNGDIDIVNNGQLSHRNLQFGDVASPSPGLSIRHRSNGDIKSSDGTGFFFNQGHFVNEAGDTIISVDFMNASSSSLVDPNLEVTGGTLTIAGVYQQVENFGSVLNVSVSGGELIYAHMNTGPLNDISDYTFTGGNFTVLSDTNFSGDFIGGAPANLRIGNAAAITFAGMQPSLLLNNFILEGGASVTSSADVSVGGVFDWIDGSLSLAGLTIEQGGEANIHTLNANIGGIFTNNGQVNILNGGELELVRFSTHNGGFDIASGGELFIFNETQIFNSAITGGGTIRVAEVTPGQQGGLILLQDSNAGRLLMEGGYISGAGSLTLADLSTWSGGAFENGGDINFNGGVDISGDISLVRTINITGGSMNNAQLFDFSEFPGSQVFTGPLPAGAVGRFNIAGGNFIVSGDSRIGSVVTIGGGALDVAGTLTAISGVDNTAGTLMGSGTIIGNVTNGAMLSPGNSPGTLTINGDLILLSSSILNLEIASSNLFDKLIVSGNLAFGGELAVFVDTTSGFSGALNDEFVPFQFGSSSNSFALVSAKPEGFGFEFDGRNLVLTSIPGLSVLVPENDSLVFTNTLETFINPFVDAGNKDVDEEDDKEKTLVCS